MKFTNTLPTLKDLISISGKAELQATGYTLGNSLDVNIIGYNKAKTKIIACHDTFGSNLSGLVVQIERIVQRLNVENFEITISK